MKKLDQLFKAFDQKVDRYIVKFWPFIRRYFTIFSTAFFLLLTAFFVIRLVNNKPYFFASVITEDLQKMEKIFHQVDRECNILNISQNHGDIDFLTVSKFVGSEVGCLNLAYPKKWKGPYLRVNPRVQGYFYEIINIEEGIFIIPGMGVKLPNGYVVGKDFDITLKTSIKEMLKPGGYLNYKGQPLALHLTFEIGDWERRKWTPGEMNRMNKMLKEVTSALSFTKNDAS